MQRLSNYLAKYLIKRIRTIDPLILRELKKELTDFNARTKKWDDPMPIKSKPDYTSLASFEADNESGS